MHLEHRPFRKRRVAKMDPSSRSKSSFLRTHKVELGTAAVLLVLGIGLGLALPEDQSMPHQFNRVITVRMICVRCQIW